MRLKSDLILLFVAGVWGSGFVAQRLAAGQLSVFYFNGGRFLLASALLYALLRLQHKWKGAGKSGFRSQPGQLGYMALAGVLLFAAAGLQQAGLATTTVGNASFITGLYVVLIPLILAVFWKQRIAGLTWAAVGLAVLGVMLLSLQAELRLSPGDGLELIGAFTWALHVILVGWLAMQGVNALTFSVVQFLVCGALNLALGLGLDPAGSANLLTAWPLVLYSAAVPIGLGFTLQIMGQRHAPAVDAAILLSTEGAFGAFFAFLLLHEALSGRQLVGCALIFAAIVLSQLKPAAAPNLEAA